MQIPIPGLNHEIKLGDAIAKATEAAGVKPCGGCQQRRVIANRIGSFVPMRSRWTKPPDVPEGWTIARMSNTVQPTRVMFEFRATPESEPSKWIVWDVIDGAYRNSHTFSSSDLAQQEYDARCQH